MMGKPRMMCGEDEVTYRRIFGNKKLAEENKEVY
jgi:hypothetical protein